MRVVGSRRADTFAHDVVLPRIGDVQHTRIRPGSQMNFLISLLSSASAMMSFAIMAANHI